MNDNNQTKENNTICTCPICGSDILEGKYGFYCNNKECKVSLRYDAYKYLGYNKKLSSAIAKNLLTVGETKKEVKCHSVKKNADFEAFLTWKYQKDEQYPNKNGLKFKAREEKNNAS